ncbi:hypothetical protein CWI75_12370 [Kineobactrum sediminis]|uniref:MtrB/PioB family decaheme-associated outer membrane protein n=1 Tax=Kineobactrum sediminis TaxID=1905677 RepID=A0A2N5Y0H4_9GAMM|nr:MtrB/PioB family decaheme-associated outer membrane protein [Kineobactrum sediminis]PLW81897.1 hypothetical protein CWI75_12370 [Kineobactrum sediminis]
MKPAGQGYRQLLLAAFACTATGAVAEDPFAPLATETRPLATRWQTDYRGALDLGLTYASTDTFMAGQYNGLQEQGATLLGNLDWRQFNGTESYWQVSLSDVGLDTRKGEIRWGLPGRLSVTIGFDSQLQVRNDSGMTPFRGSDTELILPAQWVTGQTTGEWTALADNLRQFDRELERNSWHLGLEAQLDEQWQLTSSLRYSTREGTGDVGAAIYVDAAAGDAVLLPAPIDHRTVDIDTTLAYSGTRLHLQGQLSWSEFDNRDRQLSWQNPFNSYGPDVSYPAGTGAVGLAPDNTHSSARLDGRYRFSRTLQLQFDARLALAEQDQEVLPYSVNPALEVQQGLPRERFDGEVTTGNLRAKLHWQATRKLKLELGYTLRDRDYDAPRDGYRYIPGDGGSQSRPELTVYNSTHDLRTQAIELAADYRLPLRSKLGLDYRFQEVTRENAATEETQEDRYTLNYRIQPWQSFRTTLELTWADRAADTYRWDQSYFALLDAALINDTPDSQRFINHPLLSQHYLANREQQQARLDFNYLPAPGWSFNLNLLLREDDFDKSELGLTESTFESLQISAGYAPHKSLYFSVHGGVDIYDAEQGGRAFRGGQEKNPFAVTSPLPQASDPSRNWRLASRDESLVLGGQLQWQPHEKLEFALDYRYVDTDSTQDFGQVAATDLNPANLPTVDTRLHQLDATGTWHWQEALSLRLNYRYYRYQSNDWAWRGVEADTIDKVLTFGQHNPNESAHYVGLSVLYRWQ